MNRDKVKYWAHHPAQDMHAAPPSCLTYTLKNVTVAWSFFFFSIDLPIFFRRRSGRQCSCWWPQRRSRGYHPVRCMNSEQLCTPLNKSSRTCSHKQDSWALSWGLLSVCGDSAKGSVNGKPWFMTRLASWQLPRSTGAWCIYIVLSGFFICWRLQTESGAEFTAMLFGKRQHGHFPGTVRWIFRSKHFQGIRPHAFTSAEESGGWSIRMSGSLWRADYKTDELQTSPTAITSA